MNIWHHTAGRNRLYRPSTGTVAHMPDCSLCPVRDHSLCAALKADELPRIAESTDLLTVKPGRTLFYEGDPARHFYTIRAGVVRMVRAFPDGRRSIVGFLHGGDFFGGSFGRNVYHATAEAVTRLEYCRIPVTDLESLTGEFPALDHRLLGMAADRMRAAEDHIVLLSRKTAIERVAAFLLASSEWNGEAKRFALPMARVDIADYLGLTIETVSRTLTKLVGQGTIALPDPHHVEVRDDSELRALARPEAEEFGDNRGRCRPGPSAAQQPRQ